MAETLRKDVFWDEPTKYLVYHVTNLDTDLEKGIGNFLWDRTAQVIFQRSEGVGEKWKKSGI